MAAEKSTVREVSPGLTMRKEVTAQPDGRTLIYYDFSRVAVTRDPAPAAPAETGAGIERAGSEGE